MRREQQRAYPAREKWQAEFPSGLSVVLWPDVERAVLSSPFWGHALALSFAEFEAALRRARAAHRGATPEVMP
jgi:hypothetical protein